MNVVQLEPAVLGLTLPEPAPAALTESHSSPSFDDHLQQARRQEDRGPPADAPPALENPPAEPSEISQQAPTEEPTPRETTVDSSAKEASPADGEAEEAETKSEEVVLAADVPLAEFAQSLLPPDQVHVVVCSTAMETVPMCATRVPPKQASQLDATLSQASESAADQPTMAEAPPNEDVVPAEPEAVDEPPHTATPRRPEPLIKEQQPATRIEGQPASAPVPEAPAPEVPASPESLVRPHDAEVNGREPRGEAPIIQPASPAILALGIDTVGHVSGNSAETSGAASNIQPSSDPVTAASSHEPSEAAVQRTETSTPPVPAASEGASTKTPHFVLPGRGTQRAPAAQQFSDAERARLVQRVARALETAGEGGQMRLRLSPPELGSLRLDVSVRHGVLTAHVEAETPQARLLLLDNLPVLRERLQEQNVKIERFDVDLMNQPSGGQPQGYRQRDQNQPDEPAYRPGERGVLAEAAAEPQPAISRRLSGGEQLNVVI